MDEHLKLILKFIRKRDWEKFHDPKNLAISLVLEASEVLQTFQWTKDNNLPEDKLNDIKEELADVYYWLLLLSNKLNINLDQAFLEKMKKNKKKYPVDKAKGKSTKYNKL